MPRSNKLAFRFCVTVFALAFSFGPSWSARGESVAVKIEVDTNTVLSRISPDFLGFGYETSAVAQSNYFSSGNAALIQLYRNLSSHGLIRIGGNISDHTRYVPDGAPVVHTEKQVTIINQTNLADLAAFARATGWKVMWGLNLGTGSKSEAAQEAVAVAEALGDRLQSFEIGNEVDIHNGYGLNYHGFDGYYSNYLSYKATIRSALPTAVFSGPDVAGNLGWLTAFAGIESGDVKLLTHHYYRTGAGSPGATIETLLKPDDIWRGKLHNLKATCEEKGLAFRINEINSFSGGGKSGVSDTFTSSLWCLDYLFRLASYGGEGVNMETDINQLGWISHYSPIIHDATGHCLACPEYYGLLAFALAGRGDLLDLHLEKNDLNLTAYATRDDQGTLWITVVNKDVARDADLKTVLPEGIASVQVFRLQAPSVESKDRVSLAGTEVSADGKWAPGMPGRITVEANTARLMVPHVSAVLLRCVWTDEN
jgi:hypothetical protein